MTYPPFADTIPRLFGIPSLFGAVCPVCDAGAPTVCPSSRTTRMAGVLRPVVYCRFDLGDGTGHTPRTRLRTENVGGVTTTAGDARLENPATKGGVKGEPPGRGERGSRFHNSARAHTF